MQTRSLSSSFARCNSPVREAQPQTPLTSRPARQSASDVRIAPDEDLPSHKEGQKWASTKRLNHAMDRLLARLSVAGHEINKYTGTDYSGIEALRQEIREQEQLVKTQHEVVRAAKARFDEAQTLQMASNKEVVGLLERKNSWASTDLERYMSLIRSEHTNEQGVAAAREDLLAAERMLEDARSRLERRERAQYHEEQIWSDTIRRNSTWVTFGLMGFNVVLLLANIGVVEPWRRKRMVTEIKATMEEKAKPAHAVSPAETTAAIENDIDDVVITDVSMEQLEAVQKQEILAVAASADDFVGGCVTVAPLQAQADTNATAAAEVLLAVPTGSPTIFDRSGLFDSMNRTYLRLQTALLDLFSSRTVAIRRVDLTTAVLESLAISAALTASMTMLLLRHR